MKFELHLPRVIFPLILALSVPFFFGFNAHADSISATFNGRKLVLEAARTQSERARGLMYRREMARDRGMIFLFDREDVQSFWMKNTPLPLDMIFLDETKTVVGVIENTVPFSTKSVSVDQPSKYVIELNAGMAKELEITKGMKIEF